MNIIKTLPKVTLLTCNLLYCPLRSSLHFPNIHYKIAFIIIFEKLIQTRTTALVNPLNCYLLSDARRLEKSVRKAQEEKSCS